MTIYDCQCIKTKMLMLNFFPIFLDIGISHYSFKFIFEKVIFSNKLNLSKSISLFIGGSPGTGRCIHVV